MRDFPRYPIGEPPYKIAWMSPCWFRGGLETVTLTHIGAMRTDIWRHELVIGQTDSMALSVPDGVGVTLREDAFEWNLPPSRDESMIAQDAMREIIERIRPDIAIGALTHAGMRGAREAGVPILVEYAHCGWGWDVMQHPCDLLISVSQATERRILGDRPVGRKKRMVILNGVDTGRFRRDSYDGLRFRRQIGISAQAKVVGFCGRIAWEKEPILWIETFAALKRTMPDVVGLMVGACYDRGLESAVRKIARERGLELGRDFHRVALDYARMPTAYRAMNLLMHTRRDEPFGMILPEAVLCGTPVVGFAGGGMPEIEDILHPAVRLVPPPSRGDIASVPLIGEAFAVLSRPLTSCEWSHVDAAANEHFVGERMSSDLESALMDLIGGRCADDRARERGNAGVGVALAGC